MRTMPSVTPLASSNPIDAPTPNTSDGKSSNCGSLDQLADLSLDERMALKQELSEQFKERKRKIIKEFESMGEDEQVNLAVSMLYRMRHSQHGQINNVLRPMLQRDFIELLPAKGLSNLAENILSYLDSKSLCNAERVCKTWQQVIGDGQLWKKLIEHKVLYDGLWSGLSERRGWKRYLFTSRDKVIKSVREAWKLADSYYIDRGNPYRVYNTTADWTETRLLHNFYRKLYPEIVCDIDNIEMNWKTGKHVLTRINCQSEASKGVYCLQYDDDKIVSGLRDNTIKIWDMKTKNCRSVLQGHTGSVLCLQYDERVIISGSSDATVRVWGLNGQELNTLVHHCEAVLHLRFQDGMMVTCSKDRSIAVWDMVNPQDINLRRVLVGHRAAVNVVDFDRTYIVSASGDRTIKVWSADTCEFVRTLAGHRRGIACLQYRENLVVSGSSDNTIRLWHIESGQCLRILEGHEELVRCIRFDGKRIVSGAYDGKIKVWDLQAALDPRSPPGTICLRTLVEHTGRVFRLQFDDFQIVSSSHDDTILIWDFLNYRNPLPNDIPLVFSATPDILKSSHTEAIKRARDQHIQAEDDYVEGDEDNDEHFEVENQPAVAADDDEAPDQQGMDM